MSTIIASNISDGTTSVASTYVVNGSAKAWVNFNGTVPSIRDSFNIASVSDFGTGDHQINISSAMGNANYSIVASCGPTAGNNNIGVSMQTDATPPTVSLYRAGTRRRDTNTDSDVSYAWSTIHGDLA